MEEKNYFDILKFYKTTYKLKTLIRSGWKSWNVQAERIESVAEHIYGTQMLAIALNSQFKLNLKIEHVCFLIAIHELGECIIGDITPFDKISKQQKHEREVEAVKAVLSDLYSSTEIFNAFCEFENATTKEGHFARLCDKLEANLQCKMYDELGFVDMSTKMQYEAEEVLKQKYQSKGISKLSDLWFEEDIKILKYPSRYVRFLRYLQKNGFNSIN